MFGANRKELQSITDNLIEKPENVESYIDNCDSKELKRIISHINKQLKDEQIRLHRIEIIFVDNTNLKKSDDLREAITTIAKDGNLSSLTEKIDGLDMFSSMSYDLFYVNSHEEHRDKIVGLAKDYVKLYKKHDAENNLLEMLTPKLDKKSENEEHHHRCILM